jgi:CRISPR-associated protein Csm3
MKHKRYVSIGGIITCETGLRIGGRKDATGIGETDLPILRHPISGAPYIPGSSLKGKLRSLLEMKYCPSTQSSGKPCTESPADNDVAAMFGTADMKGVTQPTRFIFRDAFLTSEAEKQLRENLPGLLAEVKTEIAMSRTQGKTEHGSLRESERIPAGATLHFNLSVRLFEEDEIKARHKGYFQKLAEGIDMLENDYLGGSGTRGYGKVKFTTNDGKPLSEYIRNLS